MHTASYPPPKYGSAPVHDLNRVRSPALGTTVEVNLDEHDYRDSASSLVAGPPVTRRSRARSIAVRVLAYLALAAMLFLFGRVLTQNPSMRRAVLDFVTFGHAEWGHTVAQWLVRHGISW